METYIIQGLVLIIVALSMLVINITVASLKEDIKEVHEDLKDKQDKSTCNTLRDNCAGRLAAINN